jgi:uncharacterized membrane protein YgcG
LTPQATAVSSEPPHTFPPLILLALFYLPAPSSLHATVLLALVSMQPLVRLALMCRLSAPLIVRSLSGPPAAGAEIDAWDLNGNGKIDGYDTTGDGNVDAWDTTGDGKIDAADTTGDGKIDAADTTGDGQIDSKIDRSSSSGGGSSAGGSGRPDAAGATAKEALD